MADTVEQLGPTSLGLRLRADGPRDETRRLADAIDAMLDRVAEGYEAQRRFAANASHELRTPLATQRALIEVSLASALTPEQLELLSRQLLATNERNEALVEGLLVLAETERGLMASTPQRLDLISAATSRRCARRRRERGVRIERRARARPSVVGEQPLLERLVANLCRTRSSTTSRRLGIGAGRRRRRHADRRQQRARGCRRSRWPACSSRSAGRRGERLDHGGGVGLGLTIARSVVAAHGGSISAQRQPGRRADRRGDACRPPDHAARLRARGRRARRVTSTRGRARRRGTRRQLVASTPGRRLHRAQHEGQHHGDDHVEHSAVTAM